MAESLAKNKRIDAQRLNNLKALVSQFEERKARATARLSESKGREWNFALLGIHTNIERFRIDRIGEFRRVVEPPEEIELAAAIKTPHLFGAIGRYSHGITHELAVDREFFGGDQSAFNFAWWVLSAIRVKTLAEFLVPVVADHSWSVISALTKQECHAQLIEDVPQAARIEDAVEVTEGHLRWVLEKITAFGPMLEIPNFRLAVEALTTHQHLVSPRMMAASLWAGIEALIGVRHELRFRLSLCVACLLEPRGPQRTAMYEQVKALYDVRSKAVHGATMNDKELRSHVGQTRRLLSALLCGMIEQGKVSTVEEIERMLLE